MTVGVKASTIKLVGDTTAVVTDKTLAATSTSIDDDIGTVETVASPFFRLVLVLQFFNIVW